MDAVLVRVCRGADCPNLNSDRRGRIVDRTVTFVYCLAVSSQRHHVDVLNFIQMSNHLHDTIYDRHGNAPAFYEHFHKLLAKCMNALRGRWENFFSSEQVCVVRLESREDVIDKLVPFQGIIGIVLLLWGLKGVFDILRTLNFIHFAPFWWLVFVATVVTELGLGFLLAYGLITKFTSGQAAEKAGQVHMKLATYQGSLGLTAIGLAVLFMLMSVTRGW